MVGSGLSAVGLARAYRQPEVYRGKVSGLILEALGLLAFGLFIFGVFVHARRLPPSTGAPQVGQKAPDFSLVDQEGNSVTLSALLALPQGGTAARGTNKTNAVFLIFYRGYW